MKILVTPLGAPSGSTAGVAKRIVDYLEGKDPQAGRRVLEAPLAASDAAVLASYYGTDMEGGGRWLGRGAAELGLVGRVVPEDLMAVLEGRHPRSGERLVSAQGSAGRRHLASGTAAVFNEAGEAFYEVRDAAVLLGVSQPTVRDLVREGDRLDGDSPPVANWLRAASGRGGRRLIPAAEIDRWLALTETGVTADAVRAAGRPEDLLSATDAARVIGLSTQYVRRLCQRYAADPSAFHDVENPEEHIVCRVDETGDGNRRYVIRRDDLAAYLSRRRPPAVRCGFDLTLTTEKSFGVLMMLADPASSAVFNDALDQANATAITYLEEHAAFTRHRGERVHTSGLTVATYLHGTSRALDPFPHRHNVIANTALDANGDRKTLDARALYEQAPVAAALATAQMRFVLTQALGVSWRPAPHGGWEIAGITPEMIREFSTRRAQIDDAVDELTRILGHAPTLTQVDQIALDTRKAKQPASIAELLAGWHDRARAVGLDAAAIRGCLRGANTPTLWTADLQAEVFARLAGPDGVTRDLNWFTRGSVIRALVDLGIGAPDAPRPLVLSPVQIERAADRFLASDLVVPLFSTRKGLAEREGAYTTLALLETQDRIRRTYTTGRDAGLAVVPPETVSEATRGLGEDQQQLVRSFTTSGMAIQVAVGPPGSGKTAAMAAAARAWESAGYRVIGAAIKGEAARLLGDAAGIETNTIAWYLTAHLHGHAPFSPDTVVIIDESSTLDDRTLARLLDAAADSGCALRMIGDPAQHGAVGAGGSWAALTQLDPGRVPHLTGNRRLRSTHEQATAALVRDGKITTALARMRATGRLIEAATAGDAHVAVVQRWWHARQHGDHHPMVDRVNHTRRRLNTLAHHLLIETGEIAAHGVTAPNGLTFCVGDEVIAKTPARHLHPEGMPDRYIRNGSTGRVTASTDEALTVDFDNLGPITIPTTGIADRAGSPGVALDYSYAVTSYAVQGATYQRSTSVITPKSSRAELYVDITRGRQDNTVIAVQPAQPRDDEPHLPTLDPPPLLHDIITGITGRPGETPAIDLDPLALPAARLRRHRSRTSISELAASETPDLATGPAVIDRAAWQTERAAEALARVDQVEASADLSPPEVSPDGIVPTTRPVNGIGQGL